MTRTLIRPRALLPSALLAVGGAALGSVAAPTAGAEPLPPASEPTASVSVPDFVEVQEVSPDGVVLSTVKYDTLGRRVIELSDGTLVPVSSAGSGAGGSSTSSGCLKATVHNRGESITGRTVYNYNTWTEWCWNRADRVITSVKTGEYLSDVASTMYYRGVISKDERFYAWKSDFNKSGHWHERQSHWENCVAKYGCISSDYPRNIVRAHSDGTYSWASYD